MVAHCIKHGQDGNEMVLNRPWKPSVKQGHALLSKEEFKLEMYKMALGLWAAMLKCLRIPLPFFEFFCEHPSQPAQLGHFAWYLG